MASTSYCGSSSSSFGPRATPGAAADAFFPDAFFPAAAACFATCFAAAACPAGFDEPEGFEGVAELDAAGASFDPPSLGGASPPANACRLSAAPPADAGRLSPLSLPAEPCRFSETSFDACRFSGASREPCRFGGGQSLSPASLAAELCRERVAELRRRSLRPSSVDSVRQRPGWRSSRMQPLLPHRSYGGESCTWLVMMLW
mmetsp:Transcript_43192/g.140094  ORF Transcript_43192/g.140094 Transcript_43192/m.140094 type:complete len:202 (-) Transcript_43192:257-862(-)